MYDKIYCKICGNKIDNSNNLSEGITYHWVEEEHCWMCDDCYGWYDGQSIEELKEYIKNCL